MSVPKTTPIADASDGAPGETSARPTLEPIISGAMHYFRVHPAQWRSRIESLRHMGLDTIETYVPWNLHEPAPGLITFDGFADLDRFLDEIAAAGLRAIVRPGPYICAEWDNGGLPSWLTARPGIRVRTSDPAFLDAVDRWFDVLIPRIAARQETRGGPVAMVQVENEYGSYGSDAAYLEHLRHGLVQRGIDVPLFTSDGHTLVCLAGGMIPGVAATVNFGTRADEAFASLASVRPDDPPFCMEYWNGWFDHWGNATHGGRDAADAAEHFDRILELGGSVNVYMAHGGTNFGCTAGANHDGTYRPTVTSYDYDAPLDESGRPTPKFWAYREAIARHRNVPGGRLETAPTLPDRVVPLEESLDLRENFDAVATTHGTTPHPPTFEELGLIHGLVRYRSRLTGPRDEHDLTLPQLADRAHVYADGTLLGVVERDGEPLTLSVPASGTDLEIIAESMGRINYGLLVGEKKGLVGGVAHHTQLVHGWSADSIPFGLMPSVPTLPWGSGASASPTGPGWRRGVLQVDVPADGFLALEGWTKGYVWVNGFCLGRYWNRGPQVTLYLPEPVLNAGTNEVIVLELDRVADPVVQVRGRADLGTPETHAAG